MSRRLGKFLCRIRLHRWRFLAPMFSGLGVYQDCERCGRQRMLSWYGGSVIFDDKVLIVKE